MATTTTLRAKPSAPRSPSRNSRTSLPRSPISATTLTFASLELAISPSRTLFPTPLPEKIPTRCPLPKVNTPSIDLIPKAKGLVIFSRLKGGGLLASNAFLSAPVNGPLLSIGSPNPFTTLPKTLSLRVIWRGVVRAVTVSPGDIPSICSKGNRIRWSFWKPTTSANTRRPSRIWIPQSSPKPIAGPVDSTVRPETRTTKP